MTATQVRCKNPKCRRVLTSPASIRLGYGKTCARKARENVAGYSAAQSAKARRIVEDGGVTRVRGGLDALYRVEGTYETYWTSPFDCTCEGARRHGNCRHSLAVRYHQVAGRYALAA